MPVSPGLRRLLHIRELEEEQGRMALESAVGELQRLENAMKNVTERARKGRELIVSSAISNELSDRLAGIEETRSAQRAIAVVSARTKMATQRVGETRHAFMSKRVERLQAETLIGQTEERDEIEAGRRSQQALDEWHGTRVHAGDPQKKAGPSVRHDANLIKAEANRDKGNAVGKKLESKNNKS